MTPVLRKYAQRAAKFPGALRPCSGMRAPSVLACLISLVALAAPSACFNPALRCRLLCDTTSDCPAGLTCHMGMPNLCAGRTDSCETPDAGRPVQPPPTEICNKDRSHCTSLSLAVRSGLVLLLDPSNLPAAPQPVEVWPDQSGQGNDALAGNTEALPVANSTGVTFVQDAAGAGFKVMSQPSLNFGTDDFLVLVVATAAAGPSSAFIAKTDGYRTNSQQVSLEQVFTAQLAKEVQARVNDTIVTSGTAFALGLSATLVGLRRLGNHVELRVNGISTSGADISNPDTPTDNPSTLYLGALGDTGTPITGLNAVIVVRGLLEDADVLGLEAFLEVSFGLNP